MIDDDVKQKDIRQAEDELVEIRDNLGGSLEALGKDKIERMRRSRSKKAAKRRMKKAWGFNKEIDEVIEYFVNGQYDIGVDGVMEIADLWKSAGLELAGFLDLMKYIEKEVVKKTGYQSSRVHIKTALEKRKNRIIIA
jgi:hypothetical protein